MQGLAPLGRLRCRALVSPAVAAIMQSHAALDHGDLRATVGDRVVEGGEATCSSRRGAGTGLAAHYTVCGRSGGAQLLARGHRKLRGVFVPSRPSIQPSRLYEGTPPHATSCCIPSRKSGPTLNGWTRRPDCRKVCISPTAIVVFPTPELVPATTMVGILVAGCVVRARMTVELTSDAMLRRRGSRAVLAKSNLFMFTKAT